MVGSQPTQRVHELQEQVDHLGEKLSPDLREFVDRVIVPALLREYLAEKKAENPVAASPRSVANSARRLSAEGIQ